MKYEILHGDCIEMMRTLPEKSVHCCVTSPPYYGLRDYGHDGQIGLEETPDAYVAKMVDVFREVRRVLRDDGTVWLNLGDSYARAGGWSDNNGLTLVDGQPSKRGESGRAMSNMTGAGGNSQKLPKDIKPKDLIGIPWRVAFALQADGWYLRQDIIWHKPNPMPESVTDRCTKAHEYIFLLSKQARYYYDAEAVKEFASTDQERPTTQERYEKGEPTRHGLNGAAFYGAGGFGVDDNGKRNRRSVWTVTTKPYKGAHFATFPPDLIEPCVLAGSPTKCCAKCGKGYKRNVEKVRKEGRKKLNIGKMDGNGITRTTLGLSVPNEYKKVIVTTHGYEPDCKCNTNEYIPATVLDPFGGSGTTAQVAVAHGRNAILCEINDKYIKLAHKRINGTQLIMTP